MKFSTGIKSNKAASAGVLLLGASAAALVVAYSAPASAAYLEMCNKDDGYKIDSNSKQSNLSGCGAANTVDLRNSTSSITMGTAGDGVLDMSATSKIQMDQYLDMTGNKVTNVANGDISATSTDAVNGSQLYAINQQVTQNTADISNINTQLSSGNVGLVRQDATTRNITVAKDTDGTVVDMTGTQGTRTVTGVSAGALTATSTDAVNGSQLYQTNANVTDLTQRVNNVEATGSAFMASQAAQPAAMATGNGAIAIGDGAKATGANSVALGNGSVADEDNTVSVGSAGNERRVTNVAAGVKGTDAVNMNQLNAVQSNVNTVARQAFAGIAAAMAMPNLTPSQPGKTVVAAGVANYKGYSAVGIGGTYRSMNNRWLVNAAASFTPHGDTGVRGQVGYEF